MSANSALAVVVITLVVSWIIYNIGKRFAATLDIHCCRATAVHIQSIARVEPLLKELSKLLCAHTCAIYRAAVNRNEQQSI